MVKKLTVLVSTISNSQVFLLKNVSSFCKSYSHFFSKNIGIYAISNDKNFNDTLANDIVSFEQLGPDLFSYSSIKTQSIWYSLELPCRDNFSGYAQEKQSSR